MSSESSYCDTTYSQDRRIEKEIKASKEQEIKIQQKNDRRRKKQFKSYLEKKIDESDSIFNLKGLYFVEYTHLKVKFRFKPFEVGKFFKEDFEISGTFIFRSRYWAVKYDTFPVQHKHTLYKLFYGKGCEVTDKDLPTILMEMYQILVRWTENYCKLKVEAYQRFLKGEDVYVGDDDHELYNKYYS